jgi:bacterioferritin (cytochrome b1)
MGREQLVGPLNNLLAQEHACYIRYSTHAVVVSGPWAESVATRLRAIAAAEAHHAEELRNLVDYLDGEPTMQVHTDDLQEAHTLQEILAVNILEEQDAIRMYRELLGQVDQREMTWVYDTLIHILAEEEAHLHELQGLQTHTLG